VRTKENLRRINAGRIHYWQISQVRRAADAASAAPGEGRVWREPLQFHAIGSDSRERSGNSLAATSRFVA
jgi:hypothetical protein